MRNSLIHARLVAAVRGLDDGAEWAEGHQLDPEWASKDACEADGADADSS